MKDGIFCLRDRDGDPYWGVVLGGRVLPIEWNSPGAARAGLEVERRRAEARKEAKS